MQCQSFILCSNEATTTIPNPRVGDVPSCQSCKDKMIRIESLKNTKSLRIENKS